MQKEYTYTVDGFIGRAVGGALFPGGLISGIIYSLANGWAYIRGFKTRGSLKWDFTGCNWCQYY